MACLSLSLLGPFQVTRAGQSLTGFESNKVRALLAYLAVESAHPHSREELACFLWPDQSELAARSNLRQALANLRRVLGDDTAQPPFLSINREFIQFNGGAEYELDLSTFTTLLKKSEKHAHRHVETCKACAQWLSQAEVLYRSSFLEHFIVSSSAFDEWAQVIREKMRQEMLSVLFHLSEYATRRGDTTQAYHLAVRQIEIDPWREEAYRQGMRALAQSGQTSAALSMYEWCRRVLSTDLGVEPHIETRTLYEAIQAGNLPQEAGAPSILRLCSPSAESNPFIGRERELDELAELLGRPACRLLTLTGPGGIGKTRLALQAAAEQNGAFAGGVCCVPLLSVGSSDQMVSAVAEAVGMTFSGGQNARQQLIGWLAEQEMLLVLDNFEHLLHPAIEGEPDSAAGDGPLGVVLEMLAKAPRVVLLVTSREKLKLQSEWVFDLRGLDYPIQDRVDEIEQYSAVQLFLLHARKMRRDFSPLKEDAQAVARICQLVEGMPLAIELAGSAAYQRSCTAIANEIERDLHQLVSPLHDTPKRHRSVWAAFEHSWSLLSVEEQLSFSRLSVFKGEFDEGAAEQVAGSTHPVLTALIDKSLLRSNSGGRYGMHELVQHYANVKLAEFGELTSTRGAHLDYFLKMAEEAEPVLYAGEQGIWLERLEESHDNLRAALKWSLENQDVDRAARLGGALARFWGLRGYLDEGRLWLAQVISLLETGSASALIQAKVWMGAGMLAWRQSAYDLSSEYMEKSLTYTRQTGDEAAVSRVLQALATIEMARGSYARSTAILEEVLALDRKNENHENLAYDLGSLADVAFQQGNYALAQSFYEKSLALHRERGDKNSIAICLHNLGEVNHQLGDDAQSRVLTVEAAALFRELGVKQGLAVSLANLGELAVGAGDASGGQILYREALKLQQELGAKGDILSILLILAAFALQSDQPARAVRLFAAAQALRQSIDVALSQAQVTEYETHITSARARLKEPDFAQAWTEGSAMTVEAAIAYAQEEGSAGEGSRCHERW